MSFFRYYRENRDADGTPLWWPGGPTGHPFRGNAPPVTTQGEYEELPLSGVARCKIFDLSKPEDLRQYTEIRSRCVAGLYVCLDRDRTWDPETKNYRIFLEWVELGYDLPPPKSGVPINAPPSMPPVLREFLKAPSEISNDEPAYQKLAGLQRADEGW